MAEEHDAAAANALDSQLEDSQQLMTSMAQVNYYASVIQSHWRGYQVRKILGNVHLDPFEGPQEQTAGEPQQMQPLPQEQQGAGRQQGSNDVFKPVTGTVVRNRGMLQAAAQRKQQAQQQHHKIHCWKQFSVRQAKRYVPAPARASRRAVPESACYRIRIQSVSNLPPINQACYDATYELQLGVSLYDEALGAFYGNTCYSPSDVLTHQHQQTAAAVAGHGADVAMEFNFDVYFHSVVSDPQCKAVVEVIIVEKDSAGASTGQFSIGWAQLPLFTQSGSGGHLPGSQPAAAPIMSGTPRYLLFRSLCGEGLQPPIVIQGCHMTYQTAAYPAMNAAKPLLPPDFLVSFTDIVPGLRRFDSNGQITTSHKRVLSTLASPMLAPVFRVGLDKLQLRLPQVLHNLISVLPQLMGVLPPPDLQALLAVPCQPLVVRYTLLAGVHNGRTFVGPQLAIQQLQVQSIVGSVVLQPQEAAHMQLEAAVADELVVLILELLAEPAVEQGAEGFVGPVLVGRVVAPLFQHIPPDNSSAVLSTGLQKLSFNCSSMTACCSTDDCPLNLLGGMTHGMLPLNWRAMLGDTAVRSVLAPALQFQLEPAGMASSIPAAPAQILTALAPSVTSNVTRAAIEHPAEPQQQAVVLQQPPAAAKVRRQTQQAEPEVVPRPKRVTADVVRLPGETRASMAIRQAAKDLEEAASIPLLESSEDQVPDQRQSHTDSSRQTSADGTAQQDQQVQQLTDTMQQQISALTRAVEELKEERQTLRSSLTALESTVTAHVQHGTAAASEHHPMPGSPSVAAATATVWSAGGDASSHRGAPRSPQAATGSLSAVELERLKALQPTVAGTAGQAMTAHNTAASPAAPLAATTAQAAASDPQPVNRLSPKAMDVEARDPHTASDIVLQVLAFRPTADPEAAALLPASLKSLYFSFQFYKFGPLVTEPCLLAADNSAAAAEHDVAVGMVGRQHTYVLVPSKQQQHSGAGLVLKYQVDGSNPRQLLPGEDPQQAAFSSHMAFCNYLAIHRLALDVWDGDSLLQLGQCSANLQGLLRQGQESSEIVIEAPVLQPDSSGPLFAGVAEQQEVQAHEPVQLGVLVLRLINIGREPSNAAARTPDFNAVQPEPKASGKKVRLRAVPLEPSSPIAKELRGRTSSNSSPFKVDWQQQQAASADGSPQAQSAGVDAATAASDIISFEQRKAARARQLQQLLSKSPAKGVPGSPMHNGFMQPATPQNSPIRKPGPATVVAGAGSPAAQGQEDPYKAVQRQLLADVDAVRKRQKAGFIRSLRKDLVSSCTIQPSPGQTLLLEHPLHNPLGRDTVFELRISHPGELSAVETMQEYRQLQQAAGPAVLTTGKGAAAAGQVPTMSAVARAVNSTGGHQQFSNTGRIFMAANDRVSIPLIFRMSWDGSESLRQPQEQQQQHVVTVEFIPLELGYPVSTLELQVQRQPAIIDRTLHYHSTEQDTVWASIPLAAATSSASNAVLAAAAAQRLAAAAAQRLAAAASRLDVTVHVSNTAGPSAAAGSGGPDVVTLRYKCGPAPEVVQFYVWLYGDGCMAKPLETWQVFVHALQRVDMRAVVGQASSTSLAVAAGTAGQRQVVCYSSNPAELQPTPAQLKLPAGGITALNLTFKPWRAGRQWVRVHLVDTGTKQVVHALLVATEATLPPISRSFEVELQAGSVVQRQILYTNPYTHTAQTVQCFKFTTNSPWLLSFQPGVLDLAPRDSKPLTLMIDARLLKAGVVVQALVFVQDELGRQEECLGLLVRCL